MQVLELIGYLVAYFSTLYTWTPTFQRAHLVHFDRAVMYCFILMQREQ